MILLEDYDIIGWGIGYWIILLDDYDITGWGIGYWMILLDDYGIIGWGRSRWGRPIAQNQLETVRIFFHAHILRHIMVILYASFCLFMILLSGVSGYVLCLHCIIVIIVANSRFT